VTGVQTCALPIYEGQESIQFQFWLAPQTVHATLNMLYTNGVEFYDASSPTGLPIVLVNKDTKTCSGTDFSQTKYSLFHGKPEHYSPEWTTYMDNLETWPDPTGVIFTLASYDEMRRYVLESESENQGQQPRNSFKAPPAPPSAPPAMARPPVAPPVVAPAPEPMQAPMPPPVAPPAFTPAPTPPAAPKPPSAPVPVPPPAAPTPPPGFGAVPMAPGMSPERKAAPGKRHNW
jgi:hypothetical protein